RSRPSPTLFPYTTLFRSHTVAAGHIGEDAADDRPDQRADELAGREPAQGIAEPVFRDLARDERNCGAGKAGEDAHQRAASEKLRSEEHTSELQSLAYLVC